MQPSGYRRKTEHLVGSKNELQYYRVMTESHGKLFFDSEDEYHQWSGKKDKKDRKAVVKHTRHHNNT